MSAVLLSHGYFLAEDEKEQQILKPYAPLGLLYLSSWLKRAGIEVEVFDSTFSTFAEAEARLRRPGPANRVVGFYANLMTRGNVVRLARVAKAAGWIVVLGGPEPASFEEEYLSRGGDVVVRGEGERTLEELVPLLEARGADPAALSGVPGITFRGADGCLVRTADRPTIPDLDTIPWPDRAAVDLRRYVETWRKAHGTGSVSIITARGCPYHCNWCSHGVYGFTHRRRKPAAVAEEIAFLAAEYRPEMLWIADDVFNIRHAWLFEFAEEMEKRSLRIPFECICRADRMTDEVARTLARLGCFRVWIGSESGSQRILDAMERGVTAGQVRESVAMLRRAGIESGMFLMWGYEGEEIEDIAATVDHVRLADPDVFFTTVSYPIGGTGYAARVDGRAVRPADWESSTDRDIRIRGRHSRRFYDAASKWLRSEVELARLRRQPGIGASRLVRMGGLYAKAKTARLALEIRDQEVEA